MKKVLYICDLRYIDRKVTKSVIDSYGSEHAEIVFVHITADGLPDMEDVFAQNLFLSEIAPFVGYDQITLINLKGKNKQEQLQSVINEVKPSLIAVSRRRYGVCNSLFAKELKNKKPTYHNIPLVAIGKDLNV